MTDAASRRRDARAGRSDARRRTSRLPQTVYWRRRLGVAGAFVLVSWMLARAVGALLGNGASVDAQQQSDTSGAPTAAAPSDPCPPEGYQPPSPTEEPPPDLVARLQEALGHRSFAVRDASISVWIEGYGEVASLEPDAPLAPASNQKLFTAMGALVLLDHDQRFVTELVATGPVNDGTLDGDLVIVGGGDPLIKREGPHSLQTIVQQVKDAGVTHITGSIVGDESRYDDVRRAPGWLDWQMPLPGGSMSALMVNSNSRNGAQAYLADPTEYNANLFKDELEDAGVAVDGGAMEGEAPDDGEILTTLESPTVAEIVQEMLRESDNMAAEMMTKEIGLQVAGEPSTAAGLQTIEEALESELCLDLQGVNDDASGISRNDKRSAREWRLMLQAAQTEPWYPILYDGLPVAGGEAGTLKHRFVETPAQGDVHAKTGSTGVSVALSGYVTTEGGRTAVFSAVANGNQPDPAVAAIDDLVLRIASDGS